MAFTEGGNEGAIPSTSPVTVVAAPGTAGVRRVVKGISLHNKDSASVTVTLEKNKNGTRYRLAKQAIAGDATYIFDKTVVLDFTDESIEAFLGSTPTGPTNFDAAFADATGS